MYEFPSEAAEKFRVLIHKGVFVDPDRGNREVPYKIYYPADGDQSSYPVIIWSHGLGGSRDGAAFLTRFLAGQGYVVVNVQHKGTDSSIWEGKPGHPWDVIRATPISRQDSLDRFFDVPFVLDQLPGLKETAPDLFQLMDLNMVGMSGHSFGALTTQIMAGQKFPGLNDELIVINEERFQAGILYSFVPMGHLTEADPAEIFGTIKMPLFFMTGTDDENPLTGQGYEYRMPVYDHAGHTEKALLVLQDGDHMVFAGSRGKLGDNPMRDEQEHIIKMMSLVWWDAYLKNKDDAFAFLHSDEAAQWLGAGGTYSFNKE